jgi:hypothetical protein
VGEEILPDAEFDLVQYVRNEVLKEVELVVESSNASTKCILGSMSRMLHEGIICTYTSGGV